MFSSSTYAKLSFYINLLFFLVLGSLTFLGMRGRISAPLKESNASISQSPYINQLPLNSVFTFIKSIDYSVRFFSDEEAIKMTKFYLGSTNNQLSIQRIQEPYRTENTANIVVILMESMTSCNLNSGLTPFLDSLSNHSMFYSNVWSAGKHTSNGIFSTLYGYPAIWSRRATSTSNKTSYCGLPGTLKQHGYFNIFFCTHDLSFDNLAEFLPMNHFDSAISQPLYPKEEIIGIYGVPDHIMFRKGIETLNKLTHKPFLAVFLTSSNHGPYALPRNIPFNPTSSSIEHQMIEYADWAIADFFHIANQCEWFNNTIFVLISDHGFLVKKETSAVPSCVHHIPLFIVTPENISKPFHSNKLASQMDVFPTVMGLLGKKYINNTFGIDLAVENRPYVFYSEDNKLVCQNDSFIYVYGKGKQEALYFRNSANNVIADYPDVAQKMKMYMLSQLQTAAWLSDMRKTGCKRN